MRPKDSVGTDDRFVSVEVANGGVTMSYAAGALQATPSFFLCDMCNWTSGAITELNK